MALKCTVGDLEQLLLEKYPAQDAESWDRTGLLVGDPSRVVTSVAVALDPTLEAVRQAKEQGANVLLTHHPAFLQPPESFLPAMFGAPNSGSLVYAAIEAGVALMNFHTALDMNEEGLFALPNALGLEYIKTIQPLEGACDTGRGYGALCRIDADRRLGLSVLQLAQLCRRVLGGSPRIWGRKDALASQVATAQGSAGSILPSACAQGADCLICGELKYHDAQAYAQAGLNIIEVGHDISEFPLAHALYLSVCALGLENVVELPQLAGCAYL